MLRGSLLFSPKSAHRLLGYFEEEAVISYTKYLEDIDKQLIEDIPAPENAIKYLNLPDNAILRDVILLVREDEAKCRDVNYNFADILHKK